METVNLALDKEYDYRGILRSRLADSMRSAHSSGNTVSSPQDAADYAIDYLLTEEGELLLRILQVIERSRLVTGVVVLDRDECTDTPTH